jgi:hypothetical protein
MSEMQSIACTRRIARFWPVVDRTMEKRRTSAETSPKRQMQMWTVLSVAVVGDIEAGRGDVALCQETP